MQSILFICAMKKEATQIARKLDLKQIDENLYRGNHGENLLSLLITGIGKQLTAINLTKYLETNEKPNLIISVGYAGSTDIKVGSWVNITRVYNYEWEIPGEEKYAMIVGGSQQLKLLDNNEIPKVECYSSESFVTQTDIEESVAFDMELHSISLICDMYNIDLISMKKISDNLSLNKYYENLKQEDVFELTSCLSILKLN